MKTEKRITSTNILCNSPLVSVIIPVYNVEKYLDRCVNSILVQTYKNLEIILVDDGSTDTSGKIITQFVEQDDRVVRVSHDKNRGLFQARISGTDVAHGDYIAFVDSDDYVSVDWFRVLVNKAEETDSDIVVGEWCFDNNGSSKSYLNLDPFRIKDYNLTGESVLNSLMETEGRCFSWTVVWNKLYSRSLWDQCTKAFHDFSDEHGHMLMWEDIAFSSGLWARAKKVTNVHGVNYFYFKYDGASTAINRSKKRNEKYIRDSASAMWFMKKQLEDTNAYTRVEDHYLSWNKRAAALLYRDLVLNFGTSYYEAAIRKAFNYSGEFIEHDEFFYQMTSFLKDSFWWNEDIKKKIVSPKVSVISFDIFDTLISRPFLEPSDLFYLLDEYVNTDNAAYFDFAQIRKKAEYTCRERLRLERPSWEEITLDEIYEEIQSLTGFSSEKISLMKEKEIELELELCHPRNSGKEFYELARFAGKKIVICSDMYLPIDVVEKILLKNNYCGWSKLYLSTDIGKTKHSSNLYKYMLKDLGIKDGHCVCHIGDNWDSDIVNAQKCGLYSMQLSKAVDVFRNYNPGVYGGELYTKAFIQNRGIGDYALTIQDYPGARCMLALSANKFFDNPHVSINDWSDFNGDPAYIGYAALGPHLMALSKWIEKRAAALNAGTVHFVARDGYMVKQAFDLVNQSQIHSNYIRLSRKALVLADVNEPDDLLSLYRKINVLHCTPAKLMEYLKPIIPDAKAETAQKVLEAQRIKWNFAFGDDSEFYHCLSVFVRDIIDFSLLPKYKTGLKQYFSQIVKPGDILFDIGYSGRPEAALSNILGFPVGSLYIHENSDIAEKRRQHYDCYNECFYSYKPKITGVMREHLLMELGPSTIGYKVINNGLQPVFEEYKEDYCSAFVTRIIQENALLFIQDMLSTLGKYQISKMIPEDIQSAAFEYYLHYSKPFDRELFSSLPFEDALGEGRVLKALDFWNNEIVARGVWPADANYGTVLPMELRNIYMDGVLVKLYKKINKWFPLGSKKRAFVRRLASIFIR